MGVDADNANAIEKGIRQDKANVKVEMNDDRVRQDEANVKVEMNDD